MNDYNLSVLTNIIGSVETGGQVYGKRRYNDYTPPYKNSPKEYTCTLGWYQAYGHEAKTLIQSIYDADPVSFMRLDSANIEDMLRYDWVAIKWKPDAKQKEALIALIDSPVGRKVQDKIFADKMVKLISDCERDYTSDIKAQMMYCEIRHLGGKSPCDRIFKRCNGKYDLDSIMASLVADQKDKSSSNQVGDKIYWSRHVKCRQFIDQYAKDESEVTPKVSITEKDITLCGHGYGTPRLIRMDKYLSQRYSQKAPNGKRKGVVVVRRYKYFSDAKRQEFAKTYKTILGRNGYSQTEKRNYCYKKYRDGKYYSDCSSSVCLTLKEIGYDMGALNTAAIYRDSRFETVPVNIVDGHITNPEILRVGDFLEFRGNDPSRPLQIGHVEAIYAINGADYTERIRECQRFLNKNYSEVMNTAGVKTLSITGTFGTRTRAAALAVWKYMANKYYGSTLDLKNRHFFESCKKVASWMTDSEVKAHGTLEEIRKGLLAWKGYSSVESYRSDKGISTPADTWYSLFN